MSESERTGVWNAFCQSFGDEIYSAGGALQTRAALKDSSGTKSLSHSVGDSTLYVEGTHRFPAKGVIFVNGFKHTYHLPAASTPPVVNQLLIQDGGLKVAVHQRDVVLLVDSDYSLGGEASPTNDIDSLRLSFVIDTAQGTDLDIIAKNYGVKRPRWMSDSDFSQLLKIVIAYPATTINAIEKVLDLMVGSGNYTIREYDNSTGRLDPNTLYVDIQRFESNQQSYKGRTFLPHSVTVPASNSTITRDSNGVVTGNWSSVPSTDPAPQVVYGVWLATDTERAGVNFCESKFVVVKAAGDPPNWIRYLFGDRHDVATGGVYHSGDGFGSSDIGKGVRLESGDCWTILEVQGLGSRSPAAVLGRRTQSNALLLDSRRVRLPYPYFEKWMEGHRLQVIASGAESNCMISNIVKVESEYSILTDNGLETSPGTVDYRQDLGGAKIQVLPNYNGIGTTRLWINRVLQVSSNPQHFYLPIPDITSTTHPYPVHGLGGSDPDPTNNSSLSQSYIVDYTSIPSGHIMAYHTQDGNSQYPFYLWDEFDLVASYLDIITAAGVKPVVTPVEEL